MLQDAIAQESLRNECEIVSLNQGNSGNNQLDDNQRMEQHICGNLPERSICPNYNDSFQTIRLLILFFVVFFTNLFIMQAFEL